MSYLLKALEKAEQERQQTPVDQQQPPAVVVQQATLPKAFIVIAVCFLLIIGYGVLKPDSPIQDTHEVASDAVTTPAMKTLNPTAMQNSPSGQTPLMAESTPVNSNKTVSNQTDNLEKPMADGFGTGSGTDTGSSIEKASAKGVAVNSQAKPQTIAQSKPQTDSVAAAELSRPLDLVELDMDTLNALPTIRFQSHIYSSAKEFRTVMINDRTLKEGMPLSSRVRLKEITPSGVIISVNQQLVALPKGQDWIAPQ